MEFPELQICFPTDDVRYFIPVDTPESRGERQNTLQAKVLVVDDERLLADTTGAILRRAGYDVKIAYDGFDAVEFVHSFGPDYVLTDILMPGMNGVELAIAVKRLSPSTRVVLFSGQAGIYDILEESRAKGFEFPLLAKPVHPFKLIDALKSV